MDLSSELIKQFAEITQPKEEEKKPSTVYGTTVSYNGGIYVKIDGSDLLTPVKSTVNLGAGQRVSVVIKNHEATVNGNLTDPSAGKNQVDKIETDVSNVVDQITEFEIIIANKVSTDELIAAEARIENLIAKKATIEDLTATNAQIENLKVNKAEIGDLKVVQADIVKLKAKDAEIENLVADKANIGDLTVINADIVKLKAKDAEIENLVADKATIGDLEALKATIGTVEAGTILVDLIKANTALIGTVDANLAKIETLVGGNLTMDNIQSLILSADKVTVANAFITNAMIDSVSANKINTGVVNTNNVNIESSDGSMLLRGTLQQFKDKNGKVRIQMGKDATGNFTFALFDETGVGTLIDSTGIKANAIGNGLIVNDMVSNDAAISGGKLDIESVITSVNGANTSIKGSRVKLDSKNQSLDVAFNTLDNTVTEQGKTVESNNTNLGIAQGQIKTLISNTTITEDGRDVTIKEAYSALKQTVDTFQRTITNVQTKLDKTTKSTKPQYYVSTSPTTPTGGTWIDTTPPWGQGKYIWQRLFFVYTDDTTGVGTPVCIQGAEGQKGEVGNTGNTGKGMVSNTPQFYAHTNSTNAPASTTSGWSDICPEYTKGKFLWVRFKMVWSNPTDTTYSNAYYEPSWDAKATAEDASTTVANKVSEFTQNLNGFKQTVKDTYTSKDELNNKGYQTSSDVTQAVNNWVAKFNQTGGYNELYNGDFKAGFKLWRNSGSNTIVNDISCPTNNTALKMVGSLSAMKQVTQNIYSVSDPMNLDTAITISMWAYLTSAGTDGTTNPYMGYQVTCVYTDGTKSYPGGLFTKSKDAWHRYTSTINTTTGNQAGKKVAYIIVDIISRDNTRTLYVTDVILSRGSTEVPFSVNPNEAYDGVIELDKTGIKISQSNYNGYFKAESSKVLLNDGKEDVVRCDSNGLYVKGQIHVVSGSISDEAFAGTLIDGQYIKTNTIKANSVLIGDFTNYCVTPTNHKDSNGVEAYAVVSNGDQIVFTNKLTHLKGGESFHISGTVYAPTSNPTNSVARIQLVWRDKSGVSITSQSVNQDVAPGTTAALDLNLITPTKPSNAAYCDIKLYVTEASCGLFWYYPTVRLMMTGNLIVDGAIDGKVIRGAELIGGQFKSTAVNEENMPLFSVSANGEIFGAEIDCKSISAEGNMSAESLSVDVINNSRYPQCLDESIWINIDPNATSDIDWFDGATYASFDDMYTVVPRNLNGYTVDIYLKGDYANNILLNRFHSGHCYLHLEKHTVRGYIYAYGPSMRYAIYGNTNDLTGGTTNYANIKPGIGKANSDYKYALYFEYVRVTLYDLNVYAASQTGVINSGILLTNLSNAYISNIEFYNNPYHGFRTHAATHIYVSGSGGLTKANTFSAVSGSIQQLNKTKQAGCGTSGTNPWYTSGNAQIFRDGVTFAVAGNSGSNDSGSTTTETHTVTVKATSGNTFRRTVYNSWKNDGTVRQGDYGYGDCDGFWFFGTQISKYTSKNITKVQITIKRNSGGSSSAINHKIVGHNYASKPSGTPSAMGSVIKSFSLATGNSITVTLSAAEIATFKKYKGIGLKNTYSSSYYSVCSATCTVKITYQE